MENIEKSSSMLQNIGQTANNFLAESPEFIEKFVKNLSAYCILQNATVTENEVVITNKKGEKFNYKKDRFVLEMYKATREGLDILKKDFSVTPYKDGNSFLPTIIVSYDKRMRTLTELGYRVEFLHLLQGDEFVELKPFLHSWKIQPKKNRTITLVAGLPKNDVIFYGVAVYLQEKLIASYFESEINIRVRRNSASDAFSKNPNAFHVMNEKFILNQVYNHIRQCNGLKTPDFDYLENYTEYQEVEPAQLPEAKQEQKTEPAAKPQLLPETETWESMKTAIFSGKVKDFAMIENKYEVQEAEKSLILEMINERANEQGKEAAK